MNGNTVGQIQYDARINTSKMKSDAREAESIAGGVADKSERSAERTSMAWSRAAKVGIAAAVTGLAALAAGAVKAATASWGQVSAVEQATIALRAYEKDGNKVNGVLNSLIAYARSDLGVLFNRKDLFQAAQGLKLYGANTDKLTDYVKIMSRSVGLGLSTWEGLNNVIGRVGSTGKLYADDLAYLRNAGFKLDSSLSGTSIGFEKLFGLLDAGIPVDALDGQANTIQGLGIRIQTAFRGIGDAILGVDAETSRFTEGSLGMLITDAMKKLPAALKVVSKGFRDVSPVIMETGANIGNALIDQFAIISKTAGDLFKGINAGDYRAVGETIGTAVRLGIEKAVQAIRFGYEWIKDVDWVNVGKTIAVDIIPGLVGGLLAGLGSAEFGNNVMRVVKDNLVPILLGAISIGLAPARVLAVFGKIFSRIPFIKVFKPLVTGIRALLAPIRSAFGDVIGGAIGGVTGRIGAIMGTLRMILFAPFKYVIDEIAMSIRMIPLFVQQTIMSIGNILRTGFTSIGAFITTVSHGIVNVIKVIFAPLTQFFSNLWGGIVAQVGGMGGRIGALFLQSRLFISSIFQNIGQFFGARFTEIINGAVRVGNYMRSVFGSVGNYIVGIFNSVTGFFRSFWNNVTGMFANAGVKVGNAIGNGLKHVINSIMNRATSIINGFIRAINGAIGAINNIPGVEIGRLSELSVPRLAEGGIVKATPGGILANIGEGGQDEAVIPLDKIDDMGIGGSGKVEININLAGVMASSRSDLRAIAKDLVSAIDEEIKAKGGTPILRKI